MVSGVLFCKICNGLVKVVTGTRRCRKSCLVFRLFCDYLRGTEVLDNHIVAAQLDLHNTRFLRGPDVAIEYVQSRIIDESMHYVLLDEAQLQEGCPRQGRGQPLRRLSRATHRFTATQQKRKAQDGQRQKIREANY